MTRRELVQAGGATLGAAAALGAQALPEKQVRYRNFFGDLHKSLSE